MWKYFVMAFLCMNHGVWARNKSHQYCCDRPSSWKRGGALLPVYVSMSAMRVINKYAIEAVFVGHLYRMILKSGNQVENRRVVG